MLSACSAGSEHSASSRSAPDAQRARSRDGPVSPVYTSRPSGAVSDSATLSGVCGTGKVSRLTSPSSGNGSRSRTSRMPIGNPGSSSHGPYPSASFFTRRTTPGGPRTTSGSVRGGTVVYLRAYTSIGSSPQWSGWKCDTITWVTSCHGRPNCARRCSAPAPQSSRIFKLPRLTQWHADVRFADGATVPVPTVTSSIALPIPSAEDDSPELNYSPRIQLVQIHARGHVAPVVGTAVPHQPRVAGRSAGPAATVAARGQDFGELRPGHEAPHPVAPQVEDRELHAPSHREVEPDAGRIPPEGRERVREVLIQQRGGSRGTLGGGAGPREAARGGWVVRRGLPPPRAPRAGGARPGRGGGGARRPPSPRPSRRRPKRGAPRGGGVAAGRPPPYPSR